MTYKLDTTTVLIALDRTKLVAISPGDEIQLQYGEDVQYTWREQDQQFMENNPDAELFLEMKATASGMQTHGVRVVPVD